MSDLRILIEKSARRLTLSDAEGKSLLVCRIALGFAPALPKTRSGDGRTPEGDYYVCLKNPKGKFGPSLGVSYPNEADARRGGMDEAFLSLLAQARERGIRPPWGSPLGGEICIHGGGAQSDWTAGCVALDDADMETLFSLTEMGAPVFIVP